MTEETNPFKVENQLKEGILILRIKGKLDALCAAEIDQVITNWIENGTQYLLLNFSDVPYLSSAGLRLLLLTTIKLKPCNGKMGVCSLSEEIEYVMKITGFDKVFDVYATEQEGYMRMKGGSGQKDMSRA